MAQRALTFEELFDAEFLTALQAFSLKAGRVSGGGRHAEHLSKQRGVGMEFADYKPYGPGDDLRRVDWNIYRRLGRVFVKQFEEQQDLPVYLLVDVSKSMFLEKPPRIRAGLRAALAVASMALSQHDSVRLFSASDRLEPRMRSAAGKRGLMTFAHRLADLQEQGQTNLTESLRQLSGLATRQGLMVIVSDFFDPAGLDKVIEALKLVRHKLLLVQLTRKVDSNPFEDSAMNGDMRLLDCETGDALEVAVTPDMVARYREVYGAFNTQLTDYASSYGAGMLQLDADEDVIDQLSSVFQSGVLAL